MVLAWAGALLGAGAATIAAAGDFGASWLWLTLWGDRLELAARLLATMVPIGALSGASIALLDAGAAPLTERLALRLGRADPERQVRWRRRLWPLPFTLLLAPGLVWVGLLLFTGGMMSRLPYAPVLKVLTGAGLIAVVWATLRAGRWAVERAARGGRIWSLGAAAAAFALYVAASKTDQHVLPNLYAYLHACLAVCAWTTAAVGLYLATVHTQFGRSVLRVGPRRGAVVVMALVTVFTFDVLTLDRSQNVRVALFDPRASASRSLMHALEPLLRYSGHTAATEDAVVRATLERAQRRALIDSGALPTWAGAHVLLVTIDALRADHLGLYGYDRPVSPNLDRFASESVVFERAYTQAPHSSYSLCSLMTSEYLHETVDLDAPLPALTLPQALRAIDYNTAAFFTQGIFHTEGERLLAFRDDAFGFERHDHTDVDAARKTNMALEEVDRIVERGEPPSLLWVHYFDVHEPYRDTTFGTSDADRYDGEIHKVDAEFDRLLRGMRSRISRDLVVVVTADHGEEFRDHGGVYHGSTLYDEQIRVPLIVQAPDLEPRRVAAPVELTDVAPTVLGMVHAPIPDTMRGDDLRGLLTGHVQTAGPVFSGVSYKRMVVRWPYKLVADLRFGLYELYDLSQDPRERTNLADREPRLLEALRGEVYAWLDSLRAAPGSAEPRDPRMLAIDRGRLRDRRSVEPLSELVADEEAPAEMRREAAKILGRLTDTRASSALVVTMRSPDRLVAAEAAIALGRMVDDRARERLRELVYTEDPDIRARAAVSLGRLRDPQAVPGLIDALWVAPTTYEREEAVRWLGRLRDERAVEPLLSLLPEFRIRHLTVIALGQIGDPRAYEALVDMLNWEHHTNIRDSVIRALGQLGDPRAVARLLSVIADEPEMGSTAESLVRLGAIELGAIGGADVGPETPGARGLERCEAGPLFHDWNYVGRTSCEVAQRPARLPLSVPSGVADAPDGAILLIRARRADTGAPATLRVRLGAVELEPMTLDGEWSEHRWSLSREALGTQPILAVLETAAEGARVRIDHVLIAQRPATLATAGSARTAAR